MLAPVLKLTNYHISFLLLPWSLYFQMSGVLQLTRLVVRNIICSLLMIIANSHGYFCCVKNMMSSNFSLNSNILLNVGLTRRLSSCNPTGCGEYEHLNSYFCKLGITHQVSCLHTHQQNGVAERKHRHIVQMGLVLLAHASMPLKYWDGAFLAVVYLINCTPPNPLSMTLPSKTS
jgi:hypothetical protein